MQSFVDSDYKKKTNSNNETSERYINSIQNCDKDEKRILDENVQKNLSFINNENIYNKKLSNQLKTNDNHNNSNVNTPICSVKCSSNKNISMEDLNNEESNTQKSLEKAVNRRKKIKEILLEYNSLNLSLSSDNVDISKDKSINHNNNNNNMNGKDQYNPIAYKKNISEEKYCNTINVKISSKKEESNYKSYNNCIIKNNDTLNYNNYSNNMDNNIHNLKSIINRDFLDKSLVSNDDEIDDYKTFLTLDSNQTIFKNKPLKVPDLSFLNNSSRTFSNTDFLNVDNNNNNREVHNEEGTNFVRNKIIYEKLDGLSFCCDNDSKKFNFSPGQDDHDKSIQLQKDHKTGIIYECNNKNYNMSDKNLNIFELKKENKNNIVKNYIKINKVENSNIEQLINNHMNNSHNYILDNKKYDIDDKNHNIDNNIIKMHNTKNSNNPTDYNRNCRIIYKNAFENFHYNNKNTNVNRDSMYYNNKEIERDVEGEKIDYINKFNNSSSIVYPYELKYKNAIISGNICKSKNKIYENLNYANIEYNKPTYNKSDFPQDEETYLNFSYMKNIEKFKELLINATRDNLNEYIKCLQNINNKKLKHYKHYLKQVNNYNISQYFNKTFNISTPVKNMKESILHKSDTFSSLPKSINESDELSTTTYSASSSNDKSINKYHKNNCNYIFLDSSCCSSSISSDSFCSNFTNKSLTYGNKMKIYKNKRKSNLNYTSMLLPSVSKQEIISHSGNINNESRLNLVYKNTKKGMYHNNKKNRHYSSFNNFTPKLHKSIIRKSDIPYMEEKNSFNSLQYINNEKRYKTYKINNNNNNNKHIDSMNYIKNNIYPYKNNNKNKKRNFFFSFNTDSEDYNNKHLNDSSFSMLRSHSYENHFKHISHDNHLNGPKKDYIKYRDNNDNNYYNSHFGNYNHELIQHPNDEKDANENPYNKINRNIFFNKLESAENENENNNYGKVDSKCSETSFHKNKNEIMKEHILYNNYHDVMNDNKNYEMVHTNLNEYDTSNKNYDFNKNIINNMNNNINNNNNNNNNNNCISNKNDFAQNDEYLFNKSNNEEMFVNMNHGSATTLLKKTTINDLESSIKNVANNYDINDISIINKKQEKYDMNEENVSNINSEENEYKNFIIHSDYDLTENKNLNDISDDNKTCTREEKNEHVSFINVRNKENLHNSLLFNTKEKYMEDIHDSLNYNSQNGSNNEGKLYRKNEKDDSIININDNPNEIKKCVQIDIPSDIKSGMKNDNKNNINNKYISNEMPSNILNNIQKEIQKDVPNFMEYHIDRPYKIEGKDIREIMKNNKTRIENLYDNENNQSDLCLSENTSEWNYNIINNDLEDKKNTPPFLNMYNNMNSSEKDVSYSINSYKEETTNKNMIRYSFDSFNEEFENPISEPTPAASIISYISVMSPSNEVLKEKNTSNVKNEHMNNIKDMSNTSNEMNDEGPKNDQLHYNHNHNYQNLSNNEKEKELYINRKPLNKYTDYMEQYHKNNINDEKLMNLNLFSKREVISNYNNNNNSNISVDNNITSMYKYDNINKKDIYNIYDTLSEYSIDNRRKSINSIVTNKINSLDKKSIIINNNNNNNNMFVHNTDLFSHHHNNNFILSKTNNSSENLRTNLKLLKDTNWMNYKKNVNSDIAHKVVNTLEIKQVKINTKQGVFEITDEGQVMFTFLGRSEIKDYKNVKKKNINIDISKPRKLLFIIEIDGINICIKDVLMNIVLDFYNIFEEELPKAHKARYEYAYNVVETLKKHTPKVSLIKKWFGIYNLMSNGSTPDFIAVLNNNVFIEKIEIKNNNVTFILKDQNSITLHIDDLNTVTTNINRKINEKKERSIGDEHDALFKEFTEDNEDIKIVLMNIQKLLKKTGMSIDIIIQNWCNTLQAYSYCLSLLTKGNAEYTMKIKKTLAHITEKTELHKRNIYFSIFPLILEE
ncbi:conserved Plasmodium protein, unknown function [Plasmodium sp. DRC-Itaito]|nr:conserved Plasmodium protein, unknown function [Plasmodium sp. DRC-Itaito]